MVFKGCAQTRATERRWPAVLPRTLSHAHTDDLIIYKCKDGLLAFDVVVFEEL